MPLSNNQTILAARPRADTFRAAAPSDNRPRLRTVDRAKPFNNSPRCRRTVLLRPNPRADGHDGRCRPQSAATPLAVSQFGARELRAHRIANPQAAAGDYDAAAVCGSGGRWHRTEID